jgi:hypothetical protein
VRQVSFFDFMKRSERKARRKGPKKPRPTGPAPDITITAGKRKRLHAHGDLGIALYSILKQTCDELKDLPWIEEGTVQNATLIDLVRAERTLMEQFRESEIALTVGFDPKTDARFRSLRRKFQRLSVPLQVDVKEVEHVL